MRVRAHAIIHPPRTMCNRLDALPGNTQKQGELVQFDCELFPACPIAGPVRHSPGLKALGGTPDTLSRFEGRISPPGALPIVREIVPGPHCTALCNRLTGVGVRLHGADDVRGRVVVPTGCQVRPHRGERTPNNPTPDGGRAVGTHSGAGIESSTNTISANVTVTMRADRHTRATRITGTLQSRKRPQHPR